MDPPPGAPPSDSTLSVASVVIPSALPSSKLRFMCSYGGQIVPRPHDKSLTYTGGDTRIVSIDRRGVSLLSLVSRFASALPLKRPFALKYQLPGHDLDSLVSLATDEDFENMLDEYDRITNSPTSSRLRTFIFPVICSAADSLLTDSDSEKWFLDALRVTKIAGKEGFFESGHVDGVPRLDSGVQTDGSAAESIVLESGSFCPTSSSLSMSTLPTVRVHADDIWVGLDKQVKLQQATNTDESDRGAASFPFQKQDLVESEHMTTPEKTGFHQENSEDHDAVELQNISAPNDPNVIHVCGYSVNHQLDQQVQYLTVSRQHYLPQYAMSGVPPPTYYPMYPSQLQHHHGYQANQSHSVYYLPVGEAPPPYTVSSVSGNLTGNPTFTASQYQMNPSLMAVSSPSSMPFLINPDGNMQGHLDTDHLHQQQQFMSSGHLPASNHEGEDPALAHLYRSQPPAPMVPVHAHTVAKDEMVSEAVSQVPIETVKQTVTSLPLQ